MVKRVIGQREPAPWPESTPFAPEQRHDIGLIGEFNIAGEFWHIQPLLDELGIRVLGSLSGDGRFAEIQTMHRAQANMLVCSRALINVARALELRYGTPWFEGSFYGIRATSDALRQLAALLGDDDLSQRTEALIAREEQAAELALQPWRERLRGRKALLYTGGVKSWSVVSALQDLGMTVVATGTRKSTEEDKQRIRELMGEEAVMLEEGNARTLLDVVYRYQADLMIAGGRNMYTAYKARLPFLDINQEREHAFAGYQGDRHPRPPAVSDHRQSHLAANPCPRPVALRSSPWQTFSAPINRWRSAPSRPASGLGAILASLGIEHSIPLVHGAQGCSAFAKVLFYSTLPRPGSPAVDGDGPHLDDYGRGRQYFHRPGYPLPAQRAAGYSAAQHRAV